jgi:N-acetylglucosamine malate deacetylase 1
MSKLDILAFGAHPDDIELGAGGTLITHAKMGYKVGLVDLTAGELGTRGSAEIRLKEAADATKFMGAVSRENLMMEDGHFLNSKESREQIIIRIRTHRPAIVLCNAPHDRHPDHQRAAELVRDACFYSGLVKVDVRDQNGNSPDPWRPKLVIHYIQFYDLQPSFLIDISDSIDEKMKAIRAYRSQFHNPASTEPSTLIASPEFLDNIRNRASYFGQFIGVRYAEGFVGTRHTGLRDLGQLL